MAVKCTFCLKTKMIYSEFVFESIHENNICDLVLNNLLGLITKLLELPS